MDEDLEVLLNLSGMVFYEDDGYWFKFDAHLVDKNENIPHGVKYCLTYHNKVGKRVVGYDNAHGIKSTKKYGGRITAWDHVHKKEKVSAYEFGSAAQLIEDFWKSVDSYKDSL